MRLRAAEALPLPLPPLGLCGHVLVLRGRTRVSDSCVACQILGSKSVEQALSDTEAAARYAATSHR